MGKLSNRNCIFIVWVKQMEYIQVQVDNIREIILNSRKLILKIVSFIFNAHRHQQEYYIIHITCSNLSDSFKRLCKMSRKYLCFVNMWNYTGLFLHTSIPISRHLRVNVRLWFSSTHMHRGNELLFYPTVTATPRRQCLAWVNRWWTA